MSPYPHGGCLLSTSASRAPERRQRTPGFTNQAAPGWPSRDRLRARSSPSPAGNRYVESFNSANHGTSNTGRENFNTSAKRRSRERAGAQATTQLLAPTTPLGRLPTPPRHTAPTDHNPKTRSHHHTNTGVSQLADYRVGLGIGMSFDTGGASQPRRGVPRGWIQTDPHWSVEGRA